MKYLPFLLNMIYLLFCIFSSSMIYVIFKIAKRYNTELSTLITYNYLSATILGLILFRPFNSVSFENTIGWLPFGIILGVLFILIFYLIGTSSQKAGITITTLANKLSLVFPVLFSIIFFSEQVSAIKYVGIATATIAVLLTVYKKDVKKTNRIYLILPVLIFFGSGLVDSIVKFVQAVKISDQETPLYTITVFLVAFICGSFVTLIGKNKRYTLHYPTILFGALLGLANFGSLYFIIRALNNSRLDSSLVFALNNMSVVAFTAIIGTLIFKEKMNKINFAGILLAILSLYFLL